MTVNGGNNIENNLKGIGQQISKAKSLKKQNRGRGLYDSESSPGRNSNYLSSQTHHSPKQLSPGKMISDLSYDLEKIQEDEVSVSQFEMEEEQSIQTKRKTTRRNTLIDKRTENYSLLKNQNNIIIEEQHDNYSSGTQLGNQTVQHRISNHVVVELIDNGESNEGTLTNKVITEKYRLSSFINPNGQKSRKHSQIIINNNSRISKQLSNQQYKIHNYKAKGRFKNPNLMLKNKIKRQLTNIESNLGSETAGNQAFTNEQLLQYISQGQSGKTSESDHPTLVTLDLALNLINASLETSLQQFSETLQTKMDDQKDKLEQYFNEKFDKDIFKLGERSSLHDNLLEELKLMYHKRKREKSNLQIELDHLNRRALKIEETIVKFEAQNERKLVRMQNRFADDINDVRKLVDEMKQESQCASINRSPRYKNLSRNKINNRLQSAPNEEYLKSLAQPKPRTNGNKEPVPLNLKTQIKQLTEITTNETHYETFNTLNSYNITIPNKKQDLKQLETSESDPNQFKITEFGISDASPSYNMNVHSMDILAPIHHRERSSRLLQIRKRNDALDAIIQPEEFNLPNVQSHNQTFSHRKRTDDMSSPKLSQRETARLATNAINLVFQLNKDSGRNEIKAKDLVREESSDLYKSNPLLLYGYKPLSSFKKKRLVSSRITKI
ncbi:UNKNOWN [Stylonychia lemnae]|uniref:Uncharacterized protein n=1 Tax=Stylonychia lemnae TaxID=5949 RepID=A0A078A9G9_STYLE|nr:UNKNOWN [Stylonychia lemnae]|eukprot:CDW78506.1 UNKNOWN [Stylonychia lemnae]